MCHNLNVWLIIKPVILALNMTYHFQRDLGRVDQVIVLSYKERMTLLSHYEHNICRDAVWSLKGEI